MKFIKYFKIILNRFINYGNLGWLPLVLIAIFVLQNYFFNLWLNIPVGPYFVRRSIVTIALGFLLFGPAVLLKKPTKYLYLGLISLLTAAVLTLQFLYYSYSGGLLQTSALFYAKEGMTILATVKILITYHLAFFVIGPLIVIAVWILTNRGIIVEKILTKKEKITAGILIIFFIFSGYGYLLLREYMESGTIAYVFQYTRLFDVNSLVSKVGIANFSLGDAFTSGLRPDEVTAADKNFIESYTEQLSTTTPGINFGLLKGRNVILIQVESLENAVIEQKIANQEITPNLNKLANEGLYFSNYYAPIGPGTTADTEFMTLNSLYSLPGQVAFIKYAYNNYHALPSRLKENGYHTYSFHGDVSSFWNRANIYPQLGYEKWFGRKDYIIPRNLGAYDLGDKDFFEQTIPKLQALPQPFMATLITLSSHIPFELPSDLETLTIPTTTTLNWWQQQYLQSIHYTDRAIGNFINQLKTVGLYDNSLILIFGDHGTFTSISSALGVNNSVFLDLQPTQVPMIILAPGTLLQGKKTTPASHLDIYPTVTNLLGITSPTNIFGHDMIAGKNNVAVSRNLVSGTVNSFIANTLAYHAAADGIYEHGTCLEMPNKKKLPTEACRLFYDQQKKAVKASDLMVKGNLIKKF